MLNLYSNPIISGYNEVNLLNVTPATANSLINDFIKLGILREITREGDTGCLVFMNT